MEIEAGDLIAVDVLREDRLLWEFWLNHGLDQEALRRGLSDLPDSANADYLFANALYGCFEGGLLDLIERESSTPSLKPRLLDAARQVMDGPAPRVTLESPEGRLLALLALRPPRGSDDANRAAVAMAEVTAWSAFHRAAGRTNLITATAAGFQSLAPGVQPPAATRQAIEAAAAGILARNRRLLALLDRLLQSFEAAGLTPILLKETALQKLVYLGDGDRMIGDLDILFPEVQIDEADRILTAIGYEAFEGIWSKAWYRAHHHHLAPLVSRDEAVKIEPHIGIWIPSGPAAPILPDLIAGSRPHPVLRARRPTTTHILFHLLVDFHGNVSIGKLCQAADVAALLLKEGKDVDLEALRNIARRTGATPFLEDSVFVLARAFGHDFLESTCPGLASFVSRHPPPFERRWLRRLALENFCGFEPRASALSIAGLRLVHKALLRPGGRASRVAFLISSLADGGDGDTEMGTIARRSRGSRAGQIARVASFPFRMAVRSFTSRRNRRNR